MSQSISSKDTQLSDILKGIDALSIQLPDFQRGWVWEDARIRALIASISCGYPVGAVMFLEYGSSNVRFKFHEFAGATPNNTITPNTLVLDGQQRLTSMYQALFCQKAVRTQTNTKKAIQRYYYLDIAKALDVNCERYEAIVGVDENKQIRKNICHLFGQGFDSLQLHFRIGNFFEGWELCGQKPTLRKREQKPSLLGLCRVQAMSPKVILR